MLVVLLWAEFLPSELDYREVAIDWKTRFCGVSDFVRIQPLEMVCWSNSEQFLFFCLIIACVQGSPV
jgi:hypothetical protein